MKEYTLSEIESEKENLLLNFKDAKVYLDSNIYMDAIREFFNFIVTDIEKGQKIIMLKEQYQEMYKIKQNKSNEESAAKAREAFRIIELLQEEDRIEIESLDIESTGSSYADPILIKRIIDDSLNNKKVVFITNDSDLKIRLREQIRQKNINKDLLTILDNKDIEFFEVKSKKEAGNIYCSNCDDYVALIKDEISKDTSETSWEKFEVNYCPNCLGVFNEKKVESYDLFAGHVYY